jgi:hypothetical protein
MTPPSRAVVIISITLAVLAVLVFYFGARIPVVRGNVFETLLIGYLVLLAGNMFRGL